MSIINNKNVNNQSSLNVDSVKIDNIEISNGIINCTELNSNLINTTGGNLQYVNVSNSNISTSTITDSNIAGNITGNITGTITNSTITDSDISGNITDSTITNSTITNSNISGYITGTITNSSYQGVITGLDVKDINGQTILISDDVNGFFINGATLRNRTSTKTIISMNANNTTVIPSITSFQIFNSTMSTNSNVSGSKLFQEGVKVINISYSHFASTLGLFDCKCYIKQSGTNTILQTFTAKRYHISNINTHYTQSFNYLSNNIQTSTIYVVVDIISAGGVFACSNTQDFISGVMYNLPNIE